MWLRSDRFELWYLTVANLTNNSDLQLRYETSTIADVRTSPSLPRTYTQPLDHTTSQPRTSERQTWTLNWKHNYMYVEKTLGFQYKSRHYSPSIRSGFGMYLLTMSVSSRGTCSGCKLKRWIWTGTLSLALIICRVTYVIHQKNTTTAWWGNGFHNIRSFVLEKLGCNAI